MDVSMYQDEATGGWLWISFTTLPSMLTTDQRRLPSLMSLVEIELSDTSLLSQVIGQPEKVRFLRCTSTLLRLLAPTNIVTRRSSDSFRFVLVSFYHDFNADHKLGTLCHRITSRRRVHATLHCCISTWRFQVRPEGKRGRWEYSPDQCSTRSKFWKWPWADFLD